MSSDLRATYRLSLQNRIVSSVLFVDALKRVNLQKTESQCQNGRQLSDEGSDQ
jgi:hypothetical protein